MAPRRWGRRGVFVELASGMVALGLSVGLVFPFFAQLLGVPARYALQTRFWLACLATGVLLGALNWLLARRVIGGRLRVLSDRMTHVGTELRVASLHGDFSAGPPQALRLPVESTDDLGRTAAAFNDLLSAVERAFAARQEAQAAEVEQLRRQLSMIETRVRQREAIKDQIEHQDAPGTQRVVDLGEVAAELGALLEDAERKVERRDDIDAGGRGVAHVLTQQLDSLCRLAERLEPVLPPPLESRTVQVDPPRPVLAPAAGPGAGERGSAAEVLAQEAGALPAVVPLVDPLDEVEVGVDALHRRLVEGVEIGRVLGQDGLPCRWWIARRAELRSSRSDLRVTVEVPKAPGSRVDHACSGKRYPNSYLSFADRGALVSSAHDS